MRLSIATCCTLALLVLTATFARAQTASIIAPPGWHLQPPLQVRGGTSEALGFWTGSKSRNAEQTLILLKTVFSGTLDEWAKAHVAGVLKDEPTVIVDENAFSSVCKKKFRAFHFRFRDTINENLVAIEQYAIKGAGDSVYFVTYSRLERQPVVPAARDAMQALCLT